MSSLGFSVLKQKIIETSKIKLLCHSSDSSLELHMVSVYFLKTALYKSYRK